LGARPTAEPRANVGLEFNLLRQVQRIVYLYAEIADRCFDLGVPEQQLNSPQIPALR
jgi:hypothetical protein